MFFTGKTFLSNFYLMEFKFNSKIFYSLEQAYQYEKTSFCNDEVQMDCIYRAVYIDIKTPQEARELHQELIDS